MYALKVVIIVIILAIENCQCIDQAISEILGSAEGITGFIKFTETYTGGRKVKVNGDIKGLTFGTKYNVHIHQYGDIRKGCRSASIGPYFEPTFSRDGQYVGNLGPVEPDTDGQVIVELTVSDISLCGIKSVRGRSVVVSKKRDDKTDPETAETLAAVVACGVIGHKKYDAWCEISNAKCVLDEAAHYNGGPSRAETVESCKQDCLNTEGCILALTAPAYQNDWFCRLYANDVCAGAGTDGDIIEDYHYIKGSRSCTDVLKFLAVVPIPI